MSHGGGRLANGILLNGVWRDYYEIIFAANERERQSDEIIKFAAEDRDSLAVERSVLLKDLYENISSLTTASTKHLRSKQIIDQVRIEKETLEGKCKSLEAQRDWLDVQRNNLLAEASSMSNVIVALETKLKMAVKEFHDEKTENKSLLELIYKRDESIEALQDSRRKQEEENEILRKSLSTKDHQYQTLLRERDRLKGELHRVSNEILIANRFKRNTQLSFTPPLQRNGRPYCPVTPPKHNSGHRSLEFDTDDEISSPMSEADVSKGSPDTLHRDAPPTAVSFSTAEHDLLSDVTTSSQIKEGHFDIKDKIYRSIIKKLQKQLDLTQQQLTKKASNDILDRHKSIKYKAFS
jgi:hypothetical protein